MSLLSFIKDAGQKLFQRPDSPAAAAPAPSASPVTPRPAVPTQEQVAELNRKAGEAIKTYVEQQHLGLQNLQVSFDGASGKVTLTGIAPSQEASEKAALCCGNVQHVASVDNQLTLMLAETPAQFHDVAKGDTLSAIAKRYYGDASKYTVIFEANKPMLAHPDKIYPGQKLRIPPA
jgi:nucleoid-associated protein YgaU